MANYKPVFLIILFSLILTAGLAVWAASISSPQPELELIETEDTPEITAPLTPEELEISDPAIANTMNPIAILETNKGTIELELYMDTMPITAGNFAKLVKEGFYDGIKFHRVIEGFMIQSGDPITKTADVARYGTGGPGYAIADEHVAGELLSNTRGTISMANSGPNSGGSQFFINLVDNTGLDFDKEPLQSKHPVFGRVIKGIEVVDAIGAAETNQRDLPLEDIVITKATIVEQQ
jgi:peptidylprolyl isomerase